jgi:hypothetical protein
VNGFLDAVAATLLTPLTYFASFTPPPTCPYQPNGEPVPPAEKQPTPPALVYGLIVLVVVACQLPLALQIGRPSLTANQLINEAVFSLLVTFVEWLVLANLLALLGYLFTGKQRLVPLLTGNALAMLPWLLLAPAKLLTFGAPVGLQAFVHVLLVGGLLLWSVALFFTSVAQAYHMTLVRALTLAALPSVLPFLFVVWLVELVGLLSRLVY